MFLMDNNPYMFWNEVEGRSFLYNSNSLHARVQGLTDNVHIFQQLGLHYKVVLLVHTMK
jgi:hypothetical protein